MTGWFVMNPPPPDTKTGRFMSHAERVGLTTHVYVVDGRVVSSTHARLPVGAPFSKVCDDNKADGWTIEPLGVLA